MCSACRTTRNELGFRPFQHASMLTDYLKTPEKTRKMTSDYVPYTEPLSWLPPGGSGRDHRPLCAALTPRATPSALSGPPRRPFCKRPTLTRADRGPTKGGRQPPAPRGLVVDGLL